MKDVRFRLTPDNPPNEGILFVDHKPLNRTGHLGHALVEAAPGEILAFYPNCSAEDTRWNGHSGFGWMEYKRSTDGGTTWSKPMIEPNSKALFDRRCGRTAMCEKAVRTLGGRILLFYLTCDMVTNGHLWEPYYEPQYAFSDDGGRTFSEARLFVHEAGRIFDALVHQGTIYVLMLANAELPGIAHLQEHEMRLYVSLDEGESFVLRSIIPFQSMLYTCYGTMCFTEDNRLLVYTYDEKDEHNLKYIVSEDGGFNWLPNRRAFFARRMRNPQLIRWGDTYFMHGRSGSLGEDPGHFILYTSLDGVTWDEGTCLRLREAGYGAYSNNLLVHLPDGRERLLIQTSHAYEKNKTNILHYWIDRSDAHGCDA